MHVRQRGVPLCPSSCPAWRCWPLGWRWWCVQEIAALYVSDPEREIIERELARERERRDRRRREQEQDTLRFMERGRREMRKWSEPPALSLRPLHSTPCCPPTLPNTPTVASQFQCTVA